MSFAGNGIMAVFSVVTYGLLFRMLSVADMGNWIFFQFAFILVDTIRTGFLQTAVVKFYAGATGERANTVAGSMWYIALLITGAVILLDLAFVPFISYIKNSSLDCWLNGWEFRYCLHCLLRLPPGSYRLYRALIKFFISGLLTRVRF